MKIKSLFLLLMLFPTMMFAQGTKKKISVIKNEDYVLKKGTAAPSFSLQNEVGETVALEDFKGKVIYIDFWGVDCKPCVAEIKNHLPQLHQNYKDKNVVFINVCVQGSEQRWKDAIVQHNLGGVNLFAEGWVNNPVCKAYRISPIPHQLLIDQNGKIVEGKASGPEKLNAKAGHNAIDLLLKK